MNRNPGNPQSLEQDLYVTELLSTLVLFWDNDLMHCPPFLYRLPIKWKFILASLLMGHICSAVQRVPDFTAVTGLCLFNCYQKSNTTTFTVALQHPAHQLLFSIKATRGQHQPPHSVAAGCTALTYIPRWDPHSDSS